MTMVVHGGMTMVVHGRPWSISPGWYCQSNINMLKVLRQSHRYIHPYTHSTHKKRHEEHLSSTSVHVILNVFNFTGSLAIYS